MPRPKPEAPACPLRSAPGGVRAALRTGPRAKPAAACPSAWPARDLHARPLGTRSHHQLPLGTVLRAEGASLVVGSGPRAWLAGPDLPRCRTKHTSQRPGPAVPPEHCSCPQVKRTENLPAVSGLRGLSWGHSHGLTWIFSPPGRAQGRPSCGFGGTPSRDQRHSDGRAPRRSGGFSSRGLAVGSPGES